MPGSRSIHPGNIAHDRTKVLGAGRKSGRTTLMTADKPLRKSGSDTSLNGHRWF